VEVDYLAVTWRPLTTLIAVFAAAGFFFTQIAARAQTTYTWQNFAGNWSTASGWSNSLIPTNGSIVFFAGNNGVNDSVVSSLDSLIFSNVSGSQQLTGSAISIGTNGIVNLSSSQIMISNDLSLTGEGTAFEVPTSFHWFSRRKRAKVS